MCSYLLIGFWFTRPIAANGCQKAFVTNRVGDFGLLLGILGLYWIMGSLEFRHLFQIINNMISKNEMNIFFLLCLPSCYFVAQLQNLPNFLFMYGYPMLLRGLLQFLPLYMLLLW